MRILLVANGNYKHDAARNYGVDSRIYNGLVRNGHWVNFFSDRDTARAASPLGTKYLGIKRTNEKLINICKNWQPELIIFGHVDIIINETFSYLRSNFSHIPLVQYNVDALFNHHNIANIKRRSKYMNANFITTCGDVLGNFSSQDNHTYFIPNMVDSAMDIHQNYKYSDLPYDVFYAMNGATRDPDLDRFNIPRYLKDNLIKEGVMFSYHGFDGNLKADGIEYFKHISQSSMGLNISRKSTGTKSEPYIASSAEKYLYSSDRIAHLMGNGMLTFTETGFGMEDMFANDEIIIFNNKEDLADKILFYSKSTSERQKIAVNGHKRYHNCWSADIITKFICEISQGNNLSQTYEWDTKSW